MHHTCRLCENTLKILVDADACPVPINDLINRTAHKLSIPAIYVANKQLKLPQSPFISAIVVAAGMDVADDYIANRAVAGDLVITHDVPLAARLVPEGVTVISPRGELFNEHNIGDRLASRDLMHSLREFGSVSGGPEPFSEKNKRAFANHFDAAIQRLRRAQAN